MVVGMVEPKDNRVLLAYESGHEARFIAEKYFERRIAEPPFAPFYSFLVSCLRL